MLEELIKRSQEALTGLLKERESKNTELVELRGKLDAGDDTVTAEQINEVRAAKADLTEQIEEQRSLVEGYEQELRDDEAAKALAKRVAPTHRAPVTVGAEKRTYSPDNAREGVSFIRDVIQSARNDLSAMTRLDKHMAEERVERSEYLQRDVGTGAFAGLTVPQYLTDLVAPAVAAGRPLADNARKLDLPADGMTVNISRITTATAVAVQATENAGVQETDIDDTLLTVNVRTIAGQQDVSLQAALRSVGAEQVIVEDLVRRYNTELDSQIINNDGTSGTHLGIRSTVGIQTVTYTDATPTPSEAWGPLWDLQQKCESAVYQGITHFVMHPRRWAFYASSISTNQTMVQNLGVAPQLIGAEQSKQYGAGVRGVLGGVPVIVDANIPTNISSTQDVILGVNANELFLWEDAGAPVFIRAEQVGAGNLSVKLVVYGFSAFTAGRYPGAHGTISGTGLTTPTYGIAAT